MAKMEVRLQEKGKTDLYGVWGKTKDRTISKDIPLLSSKFQKITNKQEGMVIPFFVLSKNYEPSSGN